MEENSNWFKLKVKYLVQTEDSIKKKTSEYVLNAMTHTEAECRITEYLKDDLPEFKLTLCNPFNITDIIKDDTKEFYFKAKLVYQDINEDNGKSTRIIENYIVQANNTKDVNDKIKERLTGSVIDFEIENISKTKIEDCFYNVEK
tara:strand:+ start:1504 stop:1938 length:435 start_codon:yes stop_codon:yes gene_type:complete